MKKLLLLSASALFALASCKTTSTKTTSATVKGINIDMITVEGGTFQMGSNTQEDEQPIHKVKVGTFKIAKYEVTQKLWKAVMGHNPAHFGNCDDCPIESVNNSSIFEFIEKLNKLTGHHYRLPTEAEWEFAARGGIKSKGYTYSGSNNLAEVGWCENAEGSTHPVGKKKPNELGIYDMSGNVCEFCSDWYDEGYYAKSPASNPTGASSGTYRVKRGGSYYFDECRNADRGWSAPVNTLEYNGFRLAE